MHVSIFTEYFQEREKFSFVRTVCLSNFREEVISIVSMLTGDSPIVTPPSKRDEAIASRIQFSTSEGDHISLLKIFRAFKQTKNEKEFCQVHYLNLRHMQFAVEVRKQLMELCRRNDIQVQSCANHTDLVRKALAEGLFTNVAKLTRDGHYVTVSDIYGHSV